MNSAKRNPVPREPGRWRALLLAAAVHGVLFAFLWIGVRWQSETPATFEAEVWSPQPREAAPPPQPEPPAPKPEPPPVVKPAPVPPVPEVKPPVEKPDIALEQEKKRRLQQEKEREEKAAAEKKKAAEKLAADKKKAEEQKRIEKEKLAQAEKQKREAELAKKKEEAEKKRRQDEAEEKLRTAARDEEMKRIAAAAGTSGDAARSQGSRADAGYMQRVGARIKSNTVFNVPDNVSGEAAVEYLVDLLPDGSVRKATMKKPSGVPGFDEAVLRAIEKSAPYPADKSGRVPSSFIVIHRPKDQ